MKDSKIIRLVLGITITLNILLYPIGTTITNPVRVNQILDFVEFDQKFLNVFTQFAVNQIAQSSGNTSEYVQSQIKGDLISKEAFNKQRIQAVNGFYTSLNNGEVPVIKLEVENPISKFTDTISEKATSFFQNITGLKICLEKDDPTTCQTLGGMVSDFFTGNNNNATPTPTPVATNEIKPNYSIETSLGKDNSNLPTVLNVYRFLKFAPEIILIIDLILLAIGYIITLPNNKYAINMIWDMLKANIFAFSIWFLFPLLFQGFSPIKVQSNLINVQTGVNSLASGVLFEFSKAAIFVPGLFSGLVVTVMIILFFYNRYKSATTRIDNGDYEKGTTYEVEEEEEETGDSGLGHSMPTGRQADTREKSEVKIDNDSNKIKQNKIENPSNRVPE